MVIWSGPARAEPAPLETYGGLPGIEDMAISPDGGGLAIVGRVGEERRLVVLDAAQKIRALVPMGNVKLEYVDWLGNDYVLLSTHNTVPLGFGFTETKHEFTAGIVVPLDGSKVRAVFGNRPSMINATFGSYGTRQVGGRWLGFFGGVELAQSPGRTEYYFDHAEPALFSVDMQNNAPHKVAAASGEKVDRSWLVDGSGAVGATLDIDSETGHWSIVTAGGVTVARGIDRLGDVELVSFGNDGRSLIYAVTDRTANLEHWFEVPLAGGAAKEILADVSIKRTYVDPTNDRIIGYLKDGAPPRPVLFDPAKQAIVDKIYRAFPKVNLSIQQWTPDFQHFLVHTSGNADSGSWYTVDVAKRRADLVGEDYPLIGAERVGAISDVTYHAADGLEMDGILTLPPGSPGKHLPVIVMPHGGPEAYDEITFDWWAQAFASRGYAVFQPNFRGSTNRSLAFRRAGYGQWGRKMQTDISDGLAELVKQGIVDPKRACIVGASYGGYAALAGVTLQQGLYRCAVAVAPVSDLSDMYWTDYSASGDNRMLQRSLDDFLGDHSRFAEVSPRKHAAQADAPILLIHGKDDTRVPFHQSQAMADALKSAHKPVELVVMQGEDHWLSHDATRKQMLDAAMKFVTEYNPAN